MTSQAKSSRSTGLITGVALSLLVIALLVTGLIVAGVFDPKPLGQLSYRDGINRQIVVDGKFEESLVHEPLSDAASVRLNAALSSGNTDIGYGLKIGDAQSSIIVAVSPLGYATIMAHPFQQRGTDVNRQDSDRQEQLLPWQTWPHVALGTDDNELWVNIEDSKLTSVRINRELLWSGAIPLAGTGIDFWAESYDGSAVIDLNHVELYLSP